jgi:aminoglycoside/choline kinase family phosphotransferase
MEGKMAMRREARGGSNREDLIAAFLGKAGWGAAERKVLAADASFRRYDRLHLDGRPAVLMDAPPPKEDVRPFLRIARHLLDLGYSAPAILAEDVEAGLLLLEDLGDATFTPLLDAGEAELPLYDLGVDLLIDLHRRPAPSGVPPYDREKLLTEASLLTDWYAPAVGIELDLAARAAYLAAWSDVLPLAHGVPDALVLRDFHVDNLMRLPGRDGIAACGLLDFQDALIGPVTYDLVSLLEDARRDIDPATRAEGRRRYLAAFPDLDPAAFDASWACLAAQRHAKVIGIFTRLCKRDGKPTYLRHIPRVWRLLEAAARHPGLAPVKAWLDLNIPAAKRLVPTP